MAKDVEVKRNRQAEKILNDLLTSDDFVKIGILGKPDNNSITFRTQKKTANGSRTPLSVGQIGLIHEFGLGNVPQRSFLRSTWEDERVKLLATLGKLAKKEAKSNNPKMERVMAVLGNYMVGKVKQKFTKNNWEKLKDPTRGGKNKDGLATPLVDTGQLRASISYEVVSNDSTSPNS